MQTTNRIHTYTRWPNDPYQRIELADVDISFAAVMRKIMGSSDELKRISDVAFRVKLGTEDELLRAEKPKPR